VHSRYQEKLTKSILTRQLGLQEYAITWRAMQLFTENRTLETPDEIWIVEHPPVYTLGLNGKREHLLNPGSIPIIKSDRGGQVTFHGPGQLVIYTLLDIKRLKLGVRPLVTLLEQAIINTLAQYGVSSEARPDAPGVYLDKKKIASIGLRIKKGCSFHGLSINNHMDLTPFEHINTCGYRELEVTQLADQGVIIDSLELAVPLLHAINTTLQT
jgi:lipoyl(octanoyl) transferase